MWEIEVSIVSRATREAIWRLWTDVARWGRWDDAIEMSDLEGSFAVGAGGGSVPKRCRRSCLSR